ncbi:hypothetical protein [Caedibacter taeniospiralis]|uniref:hypothetical protein n=1 Tax=Caedibacter taeniospiralis TaxID=28907 RepID=UPI0037C14BB0
MIRSYGDQLSGAIEGSNGTHDGLRYMEMERRRLLMNGGSGEIQIDPNYQSSNEGVEQDPLPNNFKTERKPSDWSQIKI